MITINNVPPISYELSLRLTGTREPSVSSVTVNGNAATLNATGWSYRIPLDVGVNTISIVGTAGAQTSTLSVEVSVPVPEMTLENGFNTLDEYGIMLGVPRLTGERNHFYKRRLRNTPFDPPDNRYPEVIFPAARAIGVKPQRNVFKIELTKQGTGLPLADRPYLGLSSRYVRFTCAQMRTSANLRIDPMGSYAEFPSAERLSPVDDVLVYDEDGDQIPDNEWFVDWGRYQLKFRNRNYDGKWVTASYQYEKRESVVGLTLSGLKTVLEAYQDPAGTSYLSVTLGPNTSGWSLLGLQRRPFGSLGRVTNLFWSGMQLTELLDDDYRESFYSDRKHAYGTKLAVWARYAAEKLQAGWQNAILDQTSWEEISTVASLPHIWDARPTHWKVSGDPTQYDAKQYRWFGGFLPNGKMMEPQGVRNTNWKAGIVGEHSQRVVDFKTHTS